MKVGIIGLGIIGQAQVRMFEKAGAQTVVYDPAYQSEYPRAELAKCDFAVVCVGTPPREDRQADLSYLWTALSALPKALPVLVRSTVTPGTMDKAASLRKRLIAYAPEFMYEREGGFWSESYQVPFLILGGSKEAHEYFVPRLRQVLLPGVTIHECSLLTAELAKFTVNLFWATKVTFVNEMAAVTKAFGGDWEEVRSAWLHDPRVDHWYTTMQGVPPGYGGRCWPKDIAALLEHSVYATGYAPAFLEAVEECNRWFGGEVVGSFVVSPEIVAQVNRDREAAGDE